MIVTSWPVAAPHVLGVGTFQSLSVDGVMSPSHAPYQKSVGSLCPLALSSPLEKSVQVK